MNSSSQQFWHDEEKGKAHESVFGHVRGVLTEQDILHVQNMAHAQFYSNQNEPGLHGDNSIPRWDAISDNIIANVVDTAVSLIGISKTKVSFTTVGADWELKQTAKQLEQLTFSMFQHTRLYELFPEMFRDACVFGKGAIKIFEDDNSVCCERVLIDNIVVDEQEVPWGGTPPQLHQVMRLTRPQIRKMFPDLDEDALEEADRGIRPDDLATYSSMTDPDMRVLVESWVLPCGGKPGRHVVCHSGETLVDEEYDKSYYPFVFFDWKTPLTGWYGRSLVAGLLGFQIALNEINDVIRQANHLIAVPRVFVPAGSQLLKTKLDNTIGAVIPVAGEPPTFFTPQALNAETYNYRESLRNNAFEWAGISKMSAQAVTPRGDWAGVALQELSDNQGRRFSECQGRYEERHIDAGIQMLRIVQDLVKSGVKLPEIESEPALKNLDWDLVDFDKNLFRLRVMPASVLGETPAGKIQRIVEFAQYGVQFEQEELRRLLDNPDLDSSDSLATVKERYAEWVVYKLSEGTWPDIEVAFIDPHKTANKVQAAYLDAKMSDAPEEIQEMMRQWIEQLDAEVKKLTQPQLPPEMGMPGAEEIPAGNVAETGLPGITGPTADTAQTLMPGLIPPQG